MRSSFLRLFLAVFFTRPALGAEAPAQPSYHVARVFQHGCLVGSLTPWTEENLERVLQELDAAGATDVEVVRPAGITLGTLVLGAATLGVWCPSGYITLVYRR